MSFSIEKQGETVGINVGTNVGTNELYELIKNNPRSNAKQLNSHFNVTSRTLERWLKELRSQNLIQFIGSKKTGGYWKVKN